MNRIKKYLVLVLLLGVSFLYGQNNCNCIDELDNVSKLIKNAKSYKDQIKRTDREADFEKWKEKIKQEILSDSLSKFFCVGYMQKYISFINDRHNEIYFVHEKIASNVPEYSTAIDTTQNRNDKLSGIYYAGKDKILVKKENDSIWYGITLRSGSEEWKKGMIRLRIKKMSSENFELFEYYKNGLLFYQKNIEISDGRIHSAFWNKDGKYFFNINQKENFTFKSINSSFDYIGIKTLRRTTKLIEEADKFYKDNLDKLTKDNLIIDLRNNGGGSVKQAKTLIKFLKRNAEIKRIYVLINFKTASAAELVALELKKDKRTILAGENSRGMLEYGYGNQAFTATTDCFGYKVVLSTELTNSNLSKYEYVGIKPDYDLNNQSDWIGQVVNSVMNKK